MSEGFSKECQAGTEELKQQTDSLSKKLNTHTIIDNSIATMEGKIEENSKETERNEDENRGNEYKFEDIRTELKEGIKQMRERLEDKIWKL